MKTQGELQFRCQARKVPVASALAAERELYERQRLA
jgi:hypothetical protein